MTVSDDEDEILAHFLESEVLYAYQEEEDEPKTKRFRTEENDKVESQSNSGKLNMNPDSVQPNNNSNKKKSVPRSIETGILSKIPPELFTHILKFLSSEDLVSCSLCGQLLHEMGFIATHKVKGICLEEALYSGIGHLSSKSATFKCKKQNGAMQAPLPSQVKDDRIFLDKAVADHVSMWKSRHRLADKVFTDHVCSGKTCSYHQIGNVFVCEKTGHVHVCDDTCREVILNPTNKLLVCTISGHCFDRLPSPSQMELDPFLTLCSSKSEKQQQQQGGGTDEAEPFMGSGRFARAYFLGYNCADEELKAALGFC
ncbi:hypothetical protein SLEP1_g9313 [Rubroshorea leprosula]|uniref:F-box protein n=1 Tax=Rubroshorea leprosula TaxID=152421 RepID=A0AAV5I4J1_9ROSI|nr:hypothetical protein SLEP1_g9313 [Rubroshorea leprosula]